MYNELPPLPTDIHQGRCSSCLIHTMVVCSTNLGAKSCFAATGEIRATSSSSRACSTRPRCLPTCAVFFSCFPHSISRNYSQRHPSRRVAALSPPLDAGAAAAKFSSISTLPLIRSRHLLATDGHQHRHTGATSGVDDPLASEKRLPTK